MTETTGDLIRQASMSDRDKISIDALQNFLRSESGDTKLIIEEAYPPKGTGVSSGGLFLSVKTAAGAQELLFLKYDSGAAIQPFHQYNLKGQFEAQNALFRHGAPTPEPLYLDESGASIGKPGYVMRAVPGKPGSIMAWTYGALAKAEPEFRSGMIEDALGQLARLHSVPTDTPELGFLSSLADGMNSVERQINWTLDLAASHSFSDPRITAAAANLQSRIPNVISDVLNHGDAKFDNYIFDRDDGYKVTAIIDFEMSAIAPRELDLAFLLFTTNMFSEEPRPDWYPDEARMVEIYERVSGYKLQDWEFYKDLIAMKFSVMNLSFTASLGMLKKSPEKFTPYWDVLETIANK